MKMKQKEIMRFKNKHGKFQIVENDTANTAEQYDLKILLDVMWYVTIWRGSEKNLLNLLKYFKPSAEIFLRKILEDERKNVE